MCQAPASEPSWGTPNATITSFTIGGLPTPAGTTCDETSQNFDSTGGYAGQTNSLESVSWSGTSVMFKQFTSDYGNPGYYGCTLSPDGSQMACTAQSNSALTLVSSSGTITNTGRTYSGLLGWIDATHLLVEVDSGDLGVLDPATGTLTTIAVAQANQVAMVATLPGAL